MNGRLFRPWEIVAIQELFPEMKSSTVAELIGRTTSSVLGMAYHLGLHKSAAYLASADACRLRRGGGVGTSTRFQKGLVPHNKGKKMPGWAPGRMASTQFKPGQTPWNTMPVGSTRACDGVLHRKVRDDGKSLWDNWKAVHVLAWEAEFGPVPTDHVVVFRNGDHSNTSVANLELLSRQQLMLRNSLHNLPKPLVEVIQLRGVLNRKIRSRTRAEEQH